MSWAIFGSSIWSQMTELQYGYVPVLRLTHCLEYTFDTEKRALRIAFAYAGFWTRESTISVTPDGRLPQCGCADLCQQEPSTGRIRPVCQTCLRFSFTVGYDSV